MSGTRLKARGVPAHSAQPRGSVTVRVQAYGACTVDVAGNRLGRGADIVVSILLFLVSAPGMQMPRETIIQMLWPRSPEKRQRGSLRQALYKLRLMGIEVAMNGDLVVLGARQIEPTFSVRRDAASFQAQVVQGHEPFGPFLLGFDTSTSEALDAWVEAERERAHGDARRVLAQALRARHAVADWVAAEPLARWLLQFDPLNEAATLVMAECLLLSGAKYEAIRLLDRYMSELGPGAEDLRIPATTLRRRIAAPLPRRISFAPTERHFIGREGIMAELTLCMRRARFHDGTATLLHGPAGMGKTRVLNELTKVAQIEGVRDVRVSCRESDVTRPLSVFLDVVPDLLQMPGALGCAPESLQALRRFTNEDGGNAERVSTSGVLTMPSATGLRRAVVDLLMAVSEEKPTLLTVEDVHWLDSASWEVMVDLVSRIGQCRVCLIMTSRVPHARPTPSERVPIELAIKALPPLSVESCLELAQAIGTDLSAPIDEELGEWFVHTSEGVPLFLRSLVNHWIETGNAGGIPPTLLGVIGQRLQSLSSDALCVLQTVALLGRHANLRMIEAVLEMPYFRMVSAIDDLHKAGAFDSEHEGVVVCHELIGRMAVDNLGRNARRALHRRIAEILLQSERTSGVSPVTCRDRLEHLLHAGEKKVFVEGSIAAIRGLLDAGYSYHALGISDDTLLHVGTDSEGRNTVLLLQAEALYSSGEYARLLTHPSSPANLGQGLSRWNGDAPEVLLRWIDSVAMADKGVNASQLAAVSLQIAAADRQSAAVRYAAATLTIRIAGNCGDHVCAAKAFECGKRALAELPENDLRTHELTMLYHTIFGELADGTEAAFWLLRNLDSIHSLTERLSTAMRVAFALRYSGCLEDAERLLRRVHRESLDENLSAQYSYASWRLSHLFLDAGRIAEAESWFEEFGKRAPVAREPLAAMLYHAHGVRIALSRSDLMSAKFHAAHAKAAMDEKGNNVRYGSALAHRLGIGRLAGDLDDIEATLPEAKRIYGIIRNNCGQSFLACEIALSLEALARKEEATSHLADYVMRYRREPLPYPVFLQQAVERLLSGSAHPH